MVCGPQQAYNDGADDDDEYDYEYDDHNPYVYLGWAGLVRGLFGIMENAWQEAVESKATSKSGLANLQHDYMKCFNRAVKYAMQDGPPGVIRFIVLEFLNFASEQLHEPRIVKAIATDVWVCIKEPYQDDANRELIPVEHLHACANICFEQLTGRECIKFSSPVAVSVAGEVLNILATPVDTRDILKQSRSKASSVDMNGDDFSFAYIARLCCFILEISDKLCNEKPDCKTVFTAKLP